MADNNNFFWVIKFFGPIFWAPKQVYRTGLQNALATALVFFVNSEMLFDKQ